jgi:hypothetical protein
LEQAETDDQTHSNRSKSVITTESMTDETEHVFAIIERWFYTLKHALGQPAT